MDIHYLNNNNEQNMENKINFLKVTLTLPKELDDLLFKTGQDARSNGGHRLPKTLIIRALIRVLNELKLDLHEIKTEDQLFSAIMDAVKNFNNRGEL